MKSLVIGAAVLALGAAPASAAIMGGAVTGGTAFTAGGKFVQLSTPLSNPFGAADSVGKDNFQSPNLYAFNERQNVTLTAPLVTNVGENPLPIGTVVSSYYVFFDPAASQNIVGTVDFGSRVLAVITGNAALGNSDFLENPNVNYINGSNRGLENGDKVTISGTYQVTFSTTADSPGDYVRVLTAVPEPASLAVLTGALVFLGTVRRRLRG